MLDRYEKAVMETLLDILEKEDLNTAPAARNVVFDNKYTFVVVARHMPDDEVMLNWEDELGDVFITMIDWEKRWPLVVDVFATAIRSRIETD